VVLAVVVSAAVVSAGMQRVGRGHRRTWVRLIAPESVAAAEVADISVAEEVDRSTAVYKLSHCC
jgi:hypothetical protein